MSNLRDDSTIVSRHLFTTRGSPSTRERYGHRTNAGTRSVKKERPQDTGFPNYSGKITKKLTKYSIPDTGIGVTGCPSTTGPAGVLVDDLVRVNPSFGTSRNNGTETRIKGPIGESSSSVPGCHIKGIQSIDERMDTFYFCPVIGRDFSLTP